MISKERQKALENFAGSLGVAFHDWNLLHQALTHTSYANEMKRAHIVHNERLEFLGDAVLEVVISSYLYRHFPSLPEGELTKSRASLVCEATLSKRASYLRMGEYLLFGKGELATGGRTRVSILADAFEAVLGAVYLDRGMESAEKYVLAQLQDELMKLQRGVSIRDYKTFLQEVVQQQANQTIAYELLEESGPDHEKCFRSAVLINGCQEGIGVGRNKKESEQRAASEALRNMDKL